MKEGHFELRPASRGGVLAWLRRIVGPAASRVHLSASSTVRLGGPLEVEWRVEPALETSLVVVSLVGTEIARRRLSARTGISVVEERHDFLVVELARQASGRGAAAVSGTGATVVPAGLVPSLSAKLNDIHWAVIVEVLRGSETTLREEFPVIVLPEAS